MAENFCYYNPNYDNLEGAYDWAKKTLSDHSKDKRPYLYTLDDLDNFRTHDKVEIIKIIFFLKFILIIKFNQKMN